MYDVSGKNHLVVNQYRVIYRRDKIFYDVIIIFNVHHIKKENGKVYIYFYQNKTEPLIIDEIDLISLYKMKIERNRIL